MSASPPRADIPNAVWNVSYGPRLCENLFWGRSKGLASASRLDLGGPMSSQKLLNPKAADLTYKYPLRLHRLQQCYAPQNRYDPFHIVGEHIQRHLGRNLVSSSHQKVRRTHPGLYGPERMLGRLTA
jgi:hypothetical protein